MRNLKNKINNNYGKLQGHLLYIQKINNWNKIIESYNENKWLDNLSDKINTGLVVTQEVCDNVITPLVEKQLNGLNENPIEE